MKLRHGVRRERNGTYSVRLTADERGVLATLPGQLREALERPDDPGLRRLSPPAYVGDVEREAEYRRLTGDDLLTSHLGALEVLESTAQAERLTEEQLQAWLRAINGLRLVLGTRLDVSEGFDPSSVGPDDPALPAWALYEFLTVLQDAVIQAASAAL